MARWRDDGRELRRSVDTAAERRTADHFLAFVLSIYSGGSPKASVNAFGGIYIRLHVSFM